MHGQQNDKYTEMHGQQNGKYNEMHGQQNDKYTEMHGQQNDKYTEMHGQQNIKNCTDCLKLLWYYAISNGEKLLNKVAKVHVVLKFRVKHLTHKLKTLKYSEKALHIYHSTRLIILNNVTFHHHHREQLKISQNFRWFKRSGYWILPQYIVKYYKIQKLHTF